MGAHSKPAVGRKHKKTSRKYVAKVSTALSGRGKLPSVATTRAAAQPKTGPGGIEGKKTGRNIERTAESLVQLKIALRRHCADKVALRKSIGGCDGVTKNDVERYGAIIKALPEERRAAAIDVLVWSKQGNPEVIARTAFVVGDEEIVAGAVRVFCEMGMPFNNHSFGPFCAGVLHKIGKKDPHTGTFYKFGACWVTDFLSRYPDLRRYKSSPLDARPGSRSSCCGARHAQLALQPDPVRVLPHGARERVDVADAARRAQREPL